MSEKTKFDFIVPIGWGCLNAHNLRINKLQRESLPFDWIWISDIPLVTAFLRSNFNNFMLKGNLKFIQHHGDADIYIDTATQVEFWHDFMVNQDFDTSYALNHEKYQRRIKRLYSHINQAKSVLWVRYVRIFPDKEKTPLDHMFECEKAKPEKTLQEFADLQNLYPSKKFKLLLIYTYDEPRETTEYDLSPDIHVCEISNPEKLGWQGDMPLIAGLLKKYDLTFSSKLKYNLNTFLFKTRKLCFKVIALFGNKTYRQKLKKKD
jgi:hypothetical protein